MLWTSLVKHADEIAANYQTIERLLDVIDSRQNLSIPQSIGLFAAVLEHRPEVIIELGRGAGNSTAVFAQAAAASSVKPVIHSFCISVHWERDTLPLLKPVVSESWFEPLRIYTEDLTKFNFSDVLAPHQRALVFWDAHGYPIAEHVLAHIMPRLAEKQHVVLCHDISDRRYLSDDFLSYGGKRSWQGMDRYYEDQNAYAYVCLDWIYSLVDQVIPIYDFCCRNRIELHSADHEYRQNRASHPDQARTLSGKVGILDEQSKFDYAWFTLNEAPGAKQMPGGDPFGQGSDRAAG